MKKYIKPTMESEVFIANEYIGACSDLTGGVKYLFKCDAGLIEKNSIWGTYYEPTDGDLTNSTGTINFTDNNYHSQYMGNSTYVSYSACDATHEASTMDTFLLGRFYPNGGNNNLSGSYSDVYIWFEPKGYNRYDIHATSNVNIETWGKNHS